MLVGSLQVGGVCAGGHLWRWVSVQVGVCAGDCAGGLLCRWCLCRWASVQVVSVQVGICAGGVCAGGLGNYLLVSQV